MVTYAERPWTKHYDPHVPYSLAPYPEKVMIDFLRETTQKNPDNVALVTTSKVPLVGRLDASLTYQELDNLSDTFACGLIDKGLKKGDRVAIVMPNCSAFAIAYFGILKAGGVVAATNPTYPDQKMQYQINDCDAEIVICLSLFYPLVKKIQSGTKVKTVIVANIKEYMHPVAKFLFTMAMEKKGGHRVEELTPNDYYFQDILKQYAGQKPAVDVQPDDLALFQYTGGTTGVSKGAMATHRALVANTTQIQNWVGLDSGKLQEKTSGTMLSLGAIPMFHAFGLVALLTQTISIGGTIVLVPNARDIDEVVDIIGHYKPNTFLGVPALYNAINNHPRIQNGDVSLESLLMNVSGSAPLLSETKTEYEKRSGGVILEGFGMSETPVATHSNPFMGKHKIRSVGLPYPDVDAKIVSLDDGITEVPVGNEGELIISAPNMTIGYHKMPEETAKILRELDGKIWLYTGDIARMDEEGYFYLVDRAKDMALIGGFNVYPATIENALKSHPAIFEVGVASIPHPDKIGQEALKAWIVLQPNKSVTEDELIEYCSQHLAPYEVPRRFAFIDELPKTTVGKTLRRELVNRELNSSSK